MFASTIKTLFITAVTIVLLVILHNVFRNGNSKKDPLHDPFNLGYSEELVKNDNVKWAEKILYESKNFIYYRAGMGKIDALSAKSVNDMLTDPDEDFRNRAQALMDTEEKKELIRILKKGEALIQNCANYQATQDKLSLRDRDMLIKEYKKFLLCEYLSEKMGYENLDTVFSMD